MLFNFLPRFASFKLWNNIITCVSHGQTPQKLQFSLDPSKASKVQLFENVWLVQQDIMVVGCLFYCRLNYNKRNRTNGKKITTTLKKETIVGFKHSDWWVIILVCFAAIEWFFVFYMSGLGAPKHFKSTVDQCFGVSFSLCILLFKKERHMVMDAAWTTSP